MPSRSARQHTDDTRPRGFNWQLLILLCLAQLMVILDISAVNVALPDMASDLAIGSSSIEWAITSYALVFGSLLLLGGRAADLLGRRRVFVGGLLVFTVASILAALASGATELFAARAAQGVGAAMLSPAALSIVTSAFTGADRTRALGVWGAVGGAGAATGVLLGGTLTDLLDWRAIFLINLPIGLVVAAGAVRTVAPDASPPRWRGLDLPGAGAATASLAAVVYALSQADTAGWTSPQTLGIGAAGVAGLAAFAALELRASQPLLQVRRVADRAVGGGALMMLATSAVLFGSFLLTSLYLQNVLGIGALETGLAFLPIAVAIGAGAHMGSNLVSRLGIRVPLAAALAVSALGMLLLAGVEGDGSYAADVLPGMLITSAGLGVALVSVAVAVLTGASEEEAGMLSGLNTTGHEIGGAIGIAVLVTIATGASEGSASPAVVASGLGDAYLAAGILAAIGSVVALVLMPSATKFLPKLRLAPRVAVH